MTSTTRTESDLIELFAQRADTADCLADCFTDSAPLDTLTARPRRTRVLLPMAAAAAVIAVAVVLAQVFVRSDHGRSIAGGADPALFDYSFSVDGAPSGLVLANRYVTAESSTAIFDQTNPSETEAGTSDVVEAVVYRSGRFDPSEITAGTPVSVNGSAGYYGRAIGHTDQGDGIDGTADVPSIAWEYAPDSWAVVTGTSPEYQTQQAELSIARVVHPSAGLDVRLPFTVVDVPAGLDPTALATNTTDPANLNATVRYGDGTLTIAVAYSPDAEGRVFQGGAPLHIDGFPASLDERAGGRLLRMVRGDFVIDIGSDPSISTETLQSIATGLEFTDSPTDPANWFLARDALGRG